MRNVALLSIAAIGFLTASHKFSYAQSSTRLFYKSKTIDIIVGAGVGGGYDLYARLLSRHLGQYIPGHPNVVVQNMSGSGDVGAANYVYATAPANGTVIMAGNQYAAMYKLLGGKGAQYDPTKFQWIGSIAHSNNVIYTWATSGVKNIEDAKKRAIPMAGSGIISDADIYPAIFNALIGTRFRVINGYTGTSDSDLAMERGEVAGRGGGAYSSLVSNHPDWLRDGKINILAQIGFDKEPGLANVPTLMELVVGKDVNTRDIASFVTIPTVIGYNYWVAAGVPHSQVEILRKAFEETVKDPTVAQEARRMRLQVRPKTGADLKVMVDKAAHEPQQVINRTAAILGWSAQR